MSNVKYLNDDNFSETIKNNQNGVDLVEQYLQLLTNYQMNLIIM